MIRMPLTHNIEYVTKFRQHLAQGKAEQDHGSREKYLDAAGYWHSQYQESQREIDHLQTSNSVIEREKVKLEAEIAKLRLESVEAQAPVQPDRPSTAQAKSSAKRKNPPSKNVVVLQYKKLKTRNEVVPVMSGADLTIMDELTAFEESTGLGKSLT
jgi:predicted nuclease with TOPRIM domain